MSCTAPTFSWAYGCPALPLPTYPLVIFFFFTETFFFSSLFHFAFSYSPFRARQLSLTFGTQPCLFCTFFKILFLLIAKQRLAISDIRSIYFYLRKTSSSLPTPSCLASPPNPRLALHLACRGVRAQQNLFRHMDKNPSATQHTVRYFVPGLPALPGNPAAHTAQ